jgi:hypothetical protein
MGGGLRVAPCGGFVIFLLFVSAFVACACVVVPLVAFGVSAAKDRRSRSRRAGEETRLSFLPTDGVR